MAQKNGLQNVPNMHFLLSLVLLRFPTAKGTKCVVSARKSRQQIGLKAYIYIYIYMVGTFKYVAFLASG